MYNSTRFKNFALLRSCQEKGKKGGRNTREICALPTQQNGGKMKRKNTKTKQQGCDVAKMIDTIEKAASAAKKVYLVIEPVVNAFTNRRKTNKPHKRSPGRNEAGTFQI